MFTLSLLLSVFLFISGCTTEDVEFGSTNNTSFTSSDPGGLNQTPPVEPENPGEPVVVTPQGPVVIFEQRPQDHFLDESTYFSFHVAVGDSQMIEYYCSVDNQIIPCEAAAARVELSGFDLGNHQLHIVAIDEAGLMGEESAKWLINDRYYNVEDEIIVADGGNKADIIFVIDNSGSMEEEQLEVARRISKFFSKIEGLNWKVAIVTTDPYVVDPFTKEADPFADGVLVPFPNGAYSLSPKLNLNVARDLFQQTIHRSEVGNGHERGIRNIYRSIERSLLPGASADNQRLHDFFRVDASLSIVLISDENETTAAANGTILTELEKSRGENLVQLVNDVWGAQKIFQWNSVIIRPGDSACLKNEHESYGTTYFQLSQLTDGVVEDICANDYSGALSKIGSGVANLQKTYTLKCPPQDRNGDGQVDLEVFALGSSKKVPKFKVNGKTLEFDKPLEAGEYGLEYSCLLPVSN